MTNSQLPEVEPVAGMFLLHVPKVRYCHSFQYRVSTELSGSPCTYRPIQSLGLGFEGLFHETVTDWPTCTMLEPTARAVCSVPG